MLAPHAATHFEPYVTNEWTRLNALENANLLYVIQVCLQRWQHVMDEAKDVVACYQMD